MVPDQLTLVDRLRKKFSDQGKNAIDYGLRQQMMAQNNFQEAAKELDRMYMGLLHTSLIEFTEWIPGMDGDEVRAHFREVSKQLGRPYLIAEGNTYSLTISFPKTKKVLPAIAPLILTAVNVDEFHSTHGSNPAAPLEMRDLSTRYQFQFAKEPGIAIYKAWKKQIPLIPEMRKALNIPEEID